MDNFQEALGRGSKFYKEMKTKNAHESCALARNEVRIDKAEKSAVQRVTNEQKQLEATLRRLQMEKEIFAKTKAAEIDGITRELGDVLTVTDCEDEHTVTDPYPIMFPPKVKPHGKARSNLETKGMMFARNRGRRVSKEFEDLDIHTPTGLLLPPPLKGFRHFDKLPPIHPSSRPGSSHNLDSMSAENDLHWIGDPEAINSVRRPRKTAVQLHKDLIKHRSDSELRHHHVPPTTRRKAGCVHCAVHNRCLPGSPSSPENSRRFRPSCWEPNPGSPPQQGCSPPTKRLGTPIPHRVSPLPSTQHSTSVSPRSVRQVDMTYFVTGPRLHDKDSPPSSPCLACQNEKSAIQNIIDGLAQIKQPKPPSKKTPRSPTRKPKGIQNKVQPEASICSQTPAKRTTNGKKDPSEFQERPSDPVSTILDMLDEHKYDKFISSSVNRLLATDNEHKQHHK